jgi:tRNA(adenine34) deaminase
MEPGSDEYYMRMAMAEAEKAAARDEVPVGAVVVAGVSGKAGTVPGAVSIPGAGVAGSAGGIVIARAHNLTETLNDPTAHAEMQAITAATSYLGGKYLTGCTLYVTVEPCVMCAGALAWSQVSAVVWGADDPKKGYTTTGASILHPKTVVRSGVLAEECSAIMKKFFRKKRE